MAQTGAEKEKLQTFWQMRLKYEEAYYHVCLYVAIILFILISTFFKGLN
jgi:uncharacterized membrane protein YidH (DUF202 family)